MRGKMNYSLLAIIVTVLMVSGCGKTLQIMDKEDVPAAPVEEKKEEDEDSDNGANGVMDLFDGLVDGDDQEVVKWDQQIPNNFPENTYGKCVVSQNFESDNGKGLVWNLYYTDMDENDVASYIETIEKKGWVLQDNLGNTMFNYVKDDDVIMITYGEEDGESLFGLFLSEDGAIDMTDDALDEDSHLADEIEDLNLSLPDDFPLKEVPVYDEGTLYAAQKITYSGEGTSFIAAYLCEGDFNAINDQVTSTFEKLNYDNLSITEMGMMTLIVGNSKNWSFTVTIAQTDESDYPVDVSYLLSPLED